MAEKDDSQSWDSSATLLSTKTPGPEFDEFADDLAELAFESQSLHAVPALELALSNATSDLTKRSVSIALAVCAVPASIKQVDAVACLFRDSLANEFLGPSLLDALYLLSRQCPYARSVLSVELQRIDRTSNRFLVEKASKITSRLLQSGNCGDLLPLLTELSQSSDDIAANEARFQSACFELQNIMCVGSRHQLLDSLQQASKAFELVAKYDPLRSDSSSMQYLLELFILVESRTSLSDIEQKHDSLYSLLFENDYWHDYESPESERFLTQVWRTSEAVVAAFKACRDAEEWLDISRALCELSVTLSVLSDFSVSTHKLLGAALTQMFEGSVLPKVGSLLVRAIGRRRLEAAIRNANHEEEKTFELLGRLLELSEKDTNLTSPEVIQCLNVLSGATGKSAVDIVVGLQASIVGGATAEWAESLLPSGVNLPIYRELPHIPDPSVEDAVCNLLRQIRSQLISYDIVSWRELIRLVVAVVQNIHFLRDQLPDFCLCSEDQGLGQRASESHLQDDLFRQFRREFGPGCIYEGGPIAGGRADSGVRLSKAEFPIEVKHEFQHIEREHIRRSFLGQAMTYASVRNRIAFLLILDLRASNAFTHLKNCKLAAGQTSTLYSLQESSWCEAGTVDPQISNGLPSLVIVSLVPGNRPKPSSQTKYSTRPKSARQKKNAKDKP